jgi:hypothetical protein
MRDLAAIQRRFYELVTAGEGTIEAGLLGSSRRLDIYADAYVSRLHDVLADDYPKLRVALGEDRFREVAIAYVRARPPSSFTIRDAGLGLPSYLATLADVPSWASELAALERARVEVFDGPDSTSMSREDLAAVPMEDFPDLTLGLIPASLVVPVTWTVDELWSAIEDAMEWSAPVSCSRAVLVWRRDLRVFHRTLDADEAALVPLLRSSASLAHMSATLAEVSESPEMRMVELLSRWLDAGILRR